MEAGQRDRILCNAIPLLRTCHASIANAPLPGRVGGGDKGEVTQKYSNRCEGANERYKNDIKSCSSIPHKLNVNIFIRHNDKNNDAPFNGLCSWECEQIPQTHFPTHSRSVWWKVVTGIYFPSSSLRQLLERVHTSLNPTQFYVCQSIQHITLPTVSSRS